MNTICKKCNLSNCKNCIKQKSFINLTVSKYNNRQNQKSLFFNFTLNKLEGYSIKANKDN